MKQFSFQSLKIDWPNHLIGFFSALFGILIAFELDDWRERQNQAELASNAFERMKVEIDFNQNILHANVKQSLEFVDLLNRFSEKLNTDLLFSGNYQEADSVNTHFSNYIFISTEGSERKAGYPAHIAVGTLPMITQHSSAWESAKATGVLNFMGYEKVLVLSTIYNNKSIVDELDTIQQLRKKSDEITSKAQLQNFLAELEESLRVIERELIAYDQFVNMLETAD